MKRLTLIALSAGLLLPPTVVSAQLAPVPDQYEYLQWVGRGDAVVATWGGVYLGPYVARFTTPTSPSFSIYCVDYLHSAGSQWVESTSLAAGQSDADMGVTRLGANAGSYARYQQAAYLSSLFESWDDFDAPGRVSDRRTIWSALHAAIWSVTSSQDLGYGDTELWRDDFLVMAQANAGSYGDGWYVLSGTAGYDGQEFLVRTASVPEPSALFLIAAGLLMLGVVTWRRRSTLAEA